VADQPPVEIVLGQFHVFSRNAVLVAHNAAFDMKFLKLKEAQCGIKFDQSVLDTLLLSVALQPSQESHHLDALCERYDVDIEGRHTALGDSIATAEVFVRMIALLEAKGIVTLSDALQASSQIYEVRKLQERF